MTDRKALRKSVPEKMGPGRAESRCAVATTALAANELAWALPAAGNHQARQQSKERCDMLRVKDNLLSLATNRAMCSMLEKSWGGFFSSLEPMYRCAQQEVLAAYLQS
jgi:hypothetical protein